MEKQEHASIITRPFLLSVFCIALFVYTGILSIVFLLATLFNKWISNAIDEFFPMREVSSAEVLFLSLLGLLLSGVSFYSVISIWRLKRAGLYIFTFSMLFFQAIPFVFGFGNILSIIVMGVIILSLFLFYKRLK
jgi:hypothetical protein